MKYVYTWRKCCAGTKNMQSDVIFSRMYFSYVQLYHSTLKILSRSKFPSKNQIPKSPLNIILRQEFFIFDYIFYVRNSFQTKFSTLDVSSESNSSIRILYIRFYILCWKIFFKFIFSTFKGFFESDSSTKTLLSFISLPV